MTHTPRHNDDRAERLQMHVPWHQRIPWRRRWFVAAVAGVIAAGAAFGVFELGHWAGHRHHGAEAAGEGKPRVVVEHSVPDACLQALSHGEDAFKQAKAFGEGMSDFHAGALDLLRRGDSGHAVEQLQKYLNAEADAGIDVDGDYGRQTQQAVEAYRKAQGKHKADSDDFLASLADLRDSYDRTRTACEIAGSRPKPTTGGDT